MRFAGHRGRQARNEIPKNFKIKQITSENMQKPNANNYADIRTSIDKLQLAERYQLQQTPSYKIGGGGARAARRIQI